MSEEPENYYKCPDKYKKVALCKKYW